VKEFRSQIRQWAASRPGALGKAGALPCTNRPFVNEIEALLADYTGVWVNTETVTEDLSGKAWRFHTSKKRTSGAFVGVKGISRQSSRSVRATLEGISHFRLGSPSRLKDCTPTIQNTRHYPIG